MCIYAVFVSLEDSVFMGKCVHVVSVSEECAGVTYNILGHSTSKSCYLRIASVRQYRSPAIQQEGTSICLTPWIGI